VTAETQLPSGTVTFVFSDIEGSTVLLRQLREGYREVVGEHRRLLREHFEVAGGREVDAQGDSLFFAFRRARDAALAAAAAQRALAGHDWPDGVRLRVRMGLHTGEPTLGGEGYVGLGVHRAARIMALARGGEVLVSGATHALLEDEVLEGMTLRDMGEHRLKDFEHPERIFRLEIEGLEALPDRPRAAAGSFTTIMLTDLVGAVSLFERGADEAADAVRREHFGALRRAIAEHDGREIKSTGDGLMVAFSSAVSAVRCAVDMQRAAGEGLLSIGLDAGEPLPDGEDLYGTPVVVASRLCDTADAGEILASDVVCRIAGPRVAEPIRSMGALKLRGVTERVAAGRVCWREEDQADLPGTEAAAPARTISVVIADDQKLLRTGFRVILETEPDMTVVGEAADGRTALDVVTRRRPDVVLMDIRMPELDGLAAAERILSDPDLDTAVLMLTTFDRDEYVYEALRIGASGFLLKDTPADRLLDAVRVAAAGDALLAPSITRRLIESFARVARPDPEGVPPALAELSARELEVLRLVARGLSNAEIAEELVLGENTVKTHVAHVLGKLGLRDRVQAVVLAYETGLASPELAPGETR
jgi:DNA-binding NarL/FixJ family response regulator/class 3 adenylate cyclase